MARNRYDSRADRAMKRRFEQAQRRREDRIRRETEATTEVVFFPDQTPIINTDVTEDHVWPEARNPDEYLYRSVGDVYTGQVHLYRESIRALRDRQIIGERAGKSLSETLYDLLLDMTFDAIEPELEVKDTPELDEFLGGFI